MVPNAAVYDHHFGENSYTLNVWFLAFNNISGLYINWLFATEIICWNSRKRQELSHEIFYMSPREKSILMLSLGRGWLTNSPTNSLSLPLWYSMLRNFLLVGAPSCCHSICDGMLRVDDQSSIYFPYGALWGANNDLQLIFLL